MTSGDGSNSILFLMSLLGLQIHFQSRTNRIRFALWKAPPEGVLKKISEVMESSALSEKITAVIHGRGTKQMLI